MAPRAIPSGFSALATDPSPFNRRLVRDVLWRLGVARIVEAEDGAEALSLLRNHKPDLLVLDWQVPGGGDIISTARGEGPGPAVLVTMAEPTRSAVTRARSLGVDAIVAAPFSPKELRLKVEGALAAGLARSRRQTT